MNKHTHDRLEAILGPIQDDDTLVDKVRALDEMLTRYLRDSLERSKQDELRDQIALDRRKALQSMPQACCAAHADSWSTTRGDAAATEHVKRITCTWRCTCGLILTTREDAVEHAKKTLHAVRGLFHAGTPSEEP
jgi:hypothetical protein